MPLLPLERSAVKIISLSRSILTFCYYCIVTIKLGVINCYNAQLNLFDNLVSIDFINS